MNANAASIRVVEAEADAIRAALAEITRLQVRVDKLKNFQYENLGYGKFRCHSCGSYKQVDYGDHETPTTEHAEPCSRNCPFNDNPST